MTYRCCGCERRNLSGGHIDVPLNDRVTVFACSEACADTIRAGGVIVKEPIRLTTTTSITGPKWITCVCGCMERRHEPTFEHPDMNYGACRDCPCEELKIQACYEPDKEAEKL